MLANPPSDGQDMLASSGEKEKSPESSPSRQLWIGSTHPRTLALLVADKNINQETLLATDYLNHFNEVIMLLDMVASMPECLDDAKEWRPKSYQQHFEDSSFSGKKLAIFAYENSPEQFRLPFDTTIVHMNALVASGIKGIDRALETEDAGFLGETVAAVTRDLQKFIDVASSIIHGTVHSMDQSNIDKIMES